MTDPTVNTQCACSCGTSHLSVIHPPILRFLCHCKICQKVYGKPFADIIAVKSSQIAKPVDSNIEFSKHRFPPAVKRGVCKSCQKPVVGFLPVAPFLGLAFVPTTNFPADVEFPEPVLHSFYDRRLEDVHDNLPKVSGYWPSQWAVAARFASSILRPVNARAW